MRLLLTGGAGYIGSHCAVEALREGHEIVIVDDLSASDVSTIESIRRTTNAHVTFIKEDIRNSDAIRAVLATQQVDAVLHFAGLKSVGDSNHSPLEYYDINVAGSIALLKAMQDAAVSKFVFSSSATVYGPPQLLPIDESHPLSTTNPYGETKLQVENITRDFCKANPDFSAAILRYFNPVGADQSGLIGETPNGTPANLMPFVADVAAGERSHVNVFGDDYDTRDGTGVRDYIHISDLAAAHLKAIEWTGRNNGSREFNLGNGTGTTVLEMIRAFEEASSKEIPFEISPRRQGDVASCYADPGRANRELGWVARKTIQDMCSSAWAWRNKKEN